MEMQEVIKRCKGLVSSSMRDCKRIIELLSRFTEGKTYGHPETACLGFFATASSKMMAAEMLYVYIEESPSLGDEASSDVFVYYREMEHEFMDAYADDESYQQVFALYDQLTARIEESLFRTTI